MMTLASLSKRIRETMLKNSQKSYFYPSWPLKLRRKTYQGSVTEICFYNMIFHNRIFTHSRAFKKSWHYLLSGCFVKKKVRKSPDVQWVMGHRRKTLKACCILHCTQMDGQGFGSTYYKLYCKLYDRVFLLPLLCFLWFVLQNGRWEMLLTHPRTSELLETEKYLLPTLNLNGSSENRNGSTEGISEPATFLMRS